MCVCVSGSAAGIVSEISSGAVPYTLALSVHVSSPKPISKLESNCTLDPLVFLHADHTQATVLCVFMCLSGCVSRAGLCMCCLCVGESESWSHV